MKNRVLIVAAMEEEIAELRGILTDYDNLRFFVSGIGMANASALAGEISAFKPTHVINVGIAGALTPETKIADVYGIDRVLHHDLDITDLVDIEKGHLSSGPVYVDIKTFNNLEQVSLATGSKFVSDIKERIEIGVRSGAKLVDMETVVYAKICESLNVDFYAIRGVSDGISLNNEEEKYQANLEVAISKTVEVASGIIEEIL